MIWILLVIYQIKHLLADYVFQTRYMLGKFKAYPDYIEPLACHAGIHGLMTYAIVWPIKGSIWGAGLGLFDMTIHFIVDRIKASPDLLGRFNALSKTEMKTIIDDESYHKKLPSIQGLYWKEQDAIKLRNNKYHFWSLGGDQAMHHFTHYAIIAMVVYL